MEATRPLARRLEGRVALVTGAASAIGAATAVRLADEGAILVLADVREEAPDEAGATVTARLRGRGCDAVLLGQELQGEEDWVIAVAGALTEFGRLDVLVHSAGLVSADRRGIELGLRVAADALKASGHGSVIDIRYALGYALGPFGALGIPPVYPPSVTRHRAPPGVRFNQVHPVFFHAPVPAGPRRLEEVAACVAFLASDDASFLTGLDLYLSSRWS